MSQSFTTEEIVANHGDPVWEAIWQTIKLWDIERDVDCGHAHATGDDVQRIYNAVKGVVPTEPGERERRVGGQAALRWAAECASGMRDPWRPTAIMAEWLRDLAELWYAEEYEARAVAGGPEREEEGQ